jgi:hypothetical protein
MRTLVATFAALVVVSCGEDRGAASVSGAHAPVSKPAADQVVGRMSFDYPERHVKYLPQEPDPADSAEDAVSCRRAGGDWNYEYQLGMLLFRKPESGAVRTGKRCWSNRPPTKLADAGKSCSGQEDCIGNCVSETRADGSRTPPQCQAFVEDSLCDRPLYYEGKYHWLTCPIP